MKVGRTFPIRVVMIPTAANPRWRRVHSERGFGSDIALVGETGEKPPAWSDKEGGDADGGLDMRSSSRECGTRQKYGQAEAWRGRKQRG
jgi:hypothetical protein